MSPSVSECGIAPSAPRLLAHYLDVELETEELEEDVVFDEEVPEAITATTVPNIHE